MWLGVRSNEKSVCPNQLDHVVAGGLGLDELDKLECVVKECGEEAGFDMEVARRAVEGGVVMYEGNDNWCYEERVGGGDGGVGGYKRDTLFTYDLEVLEGIVPKPVDGEVERFELVDVEEVMEGLIESEGARVRGEWGKVYKANCVPVIAEFMIRKGIIGKEFEGFEELFECLRN
ncbi:hypothetical protein TrCOL_g2642 [Triparma columacea]|uniref:Nudix hydrolase domain-containing protein n=1 Tax=Triparma columacea TaxID=722753 RepID=A0A9W7GDY6_9STRA|nr:hypothetical protein TrCOL_g2642 [Triparma columacea]